MRQSYIEESFVAEKLRELLPAGTRVIERGKSNCFSEDILVVHADGTREKYEVKSLKFMSSEQSLAYEDGKYRPYDGSAPGKYTKSIIDYIEQESIKPGSKSVPVDIDINTAAGYLKEQLLKRGNDKLVVSDSKSEKFKIFDLHDESFVLNLEECRFSLRNKPSGTRPVIPGTENEITCSKFLKDLYPGCEISQKDNRTFVRFREQPKTKKVEISPEFVACLRDDGTYEVRKRGSASVVNLTPYVTVNKNML